MFRVENCRLLISCCNHDAGLYLLEFNNNKNNIRKILTADCRGMACYQDKYLLNTTDQGILLLDQNFNKIKQRNISEPLDYHGLAVYNNQAYVSETRKNCIGIYDLKNFERIDQLKFTPVDSDIFHCNDLFIVGNRLFLSMFSYGSPWRELADNALSAGVLLEYSLEKRKLVKVIYQGLSHPHSIFIKDQQFFYCNSACFEVKRNKQLIFKTADYARGLAINHEFIFVGQSNNRKISGAGCGIYIFNIVAGMASFIELPAEEVYGIMLI